VLFESELESADGRVNMGGQSPDREPLDGAVVIPTLGDWFGADQVDGQVARIEEGRENQIRSSSTPKRSV
jgi:hypothetical protein